MSLLTQRSVFRDQPGSGLSNLGWRRALLACGVASTVLYFAMDVTATLLYDGYSYTDQTISELSAIGAPTRSFWIPFGFLYSILTMACGLGIWSSAGEKRG